MKLTRDQYEREGDYGIALQIMKALMKKGLLTEKEFQKANERLIAKLNPVWGHYPDVIRTTQA